MRPCLVEAFLENGNFGWRCSTCRTQEINSRWSLSLARHNGQLHKIAREEYLRTHRGEDDQRKT